MDASRTPPTPSGSAGGLSAPPGVPLLRTLYLYIAGGCNLKCRHCWISPEFDPGASISSYLDLGLIGNAVEEAIPLGLSSIKLTGGEPLLHPRFRDIVSLLASRRLKIMMETNGTLLDAGLARFLRETDAFGTVSVSVDGASASTHDEMRGVEGSFAMALEGVRALAAEGFRPQIICTLHEGNVSEIDDLISLAGRLGCGSVKFNHVQVIGRGGGMPGRLPLERILSLYRGHLPGARVSGSGPRILFDIPPAFRPVADLLEGGAGSCRIMGILGILSGGEMAMCGIGTAVPELVYGRLPEQSLRDVWTSSPGLLELRRAIPGSLSGACAGCIHRNACNGVCAAGNYHRTGRLDSPYWFCEEAREKGMFPATRTLSSSGGRE